MENTSIRLKQIMNDRNLRQVDILHLAEPYCKTYNVKLNKSDLSQFISGKVEPGQWKLTILGKALNVSEAWLMGYDVPMDPSYDVLFSLAKDAEYNREFNELTEAEKILALNSVRDTQKNSFADSALTPPNERRLLSLYRDLNEEGREKLLDYAEDLSASGRYIKSDPAGLVQEK